MFLRNNVTIQNATNVEEKISKSSTGLKPTTFLTSNLCTKVHGLDSRWKPSELLLYLTLAIL